MPGKKRTICAVLTGDIGGWSRLEEEDRERLPAALREVGREVSRAFPQARGAAAGVDIFRGDSWQMVVTDWPHALRAALLFSALLKRRPELPRVNTRISLAIGPVDVLPRRRASEGIGPAFTASGKGLDRLSHGRRRTYFCGTLQPLLEAFQDLDHCFCEAMVRAADPLFDATAMCLWEAMVRAADPLFDATAILSGEIAWHWTPAQARAVAGALCGQNQQDTAAALSAGISQQAVAKALRGARWTTIEGALARIEEALDGVAQLPPTAF